MGWKRENKGGDGGGVGGEEWGELGKVLRSDEYGYGEAAGGEVVGEV